MKRLFIQLTIISCLMLLPTIMFAQAPPSPPAATHGSTGDAADPTAGAPLDGGLSILLLIGAAYGGKKIQTLRKK
ncbi:MAG: PID-CTERM protein-sorting domain-containing protein [Bacteroidales bacterium]